MDRKSAVNVPVDKKIRLIFINQPTKAPESPVAEIIGIVYMPRGSMGDNDIDAALPPEGGSQSSDYGTHLAFGILKGAAIVPAGARQAQKIKPLKSLQPAVQVKAALGQFIFVPDIVVSADIKKRRIKYMDQARKIFGRQIATGNNDINFCKRLAAGILVQHRIHHIRYRQ